ncbi:dihydrodipicolinate synthase family protein [Microlunatus elymi]|uniref:Dihydrodipicolinate synthase family protein n=1 Tax=Microlunatus elymi TaxID=2596828 RepID=A0A516Q2F4_9ACTN|nr:dihydrodipicolinate synthase family protein [Microlunatus elymi]QDP97610.1 dihydrodipicolinate synthase family protein [Microlunatus elymi]
MTAFSLLDDHGRLTSYESGAVEPLTRPTGRFRSRIAYAAAHVVPYAWSDNVPGAPAEIDWDATLGFRRHLWSWGLGVADAMDTAQRNMGLDAAATRELIARSAAEARTESGFDDLADAVVVGVNTDHLDEPEISLDRIKAGYLDQLEFTQQQGAGVVLMASRHLARTAQSPQDYVDVYSALLEQAESPVILHWLGEAFDPQLAGYFGSSDAAEASKIVLQIIGEHADKVRGIKMSLLDANAEIAVRAELPDGVRLFTGDDFNYVGLIEGDGERHSDALLGAFAAVGPNASAAIQALDAGDHDRYRSILGPTEALSRQIFAAPTFYYKTGVAFLSWLNGHQPSPAMIGGLHSARSLPHLSEIVRLAAEANALSDPDLAAARWHGLLSLNGIEAGR